MPTQLTFPFADREKWFEVLSDCFRSFRAGGTYSYGDSAGFSPDFPIKDAGASTKVGANLQLKS